MLRDIIACALVALAATGCKKKDVEAAAGSAAAGSAAASSAAADAQKELTASVAGKDLGPLYGVAQPDPSSGRAHRLTFSTRPLTCASMYTALENAGPQEVFRIRTHEALRPDGALTWAYGGVAFGDGGSAPSLLVAMPRYEVAGGRVSGTLPADAGHDPGGFTVGGSFSLPECEPLPVPKLRDIADFKKTATPIEATGSTAQVSIAGKRFSVNGATALRRGEDGWEIRLTEAAHGCSDEVPADLRVVLKLGGDEPRIELGGHWIAGASEVVPLAGTAKAEARPVEGAVELALAGAMEYGAEGATYAIELSGTVTAKECAP
ncbi:MAG: hypothetical protein K8M05_08165 [Deltaproteobacteria bacterium]|nr:hypothetical protein [Kofleriaceae bacterium]